jgi:flagellin
MGLRINQNIASQNAYRNLSVTDGQLSKSLEKLSSGFRINRAADDAAGLAISEGLRSQVGGMKVAVRNAQDGVSVVQTAEGALTEVHAILQRMRDLAVQAANDSNTADTRGNITTEISSLQEELSRIANSTNFNGINLLDGSSASLSFQVGAGSTAIANAITVDLSNSNVSDVAEAIATSGGATYAIADATLVTGALVFSTDDDVDGTSEVTSRATLGAAGTYATVQDVADALNSDSDFSQNFRATIQGANGAAGTLVVEAKNGGAMELVTAPSTEVAAGAALAAPVGGWLSLEDADYARLAIARLDTQISYVSDARANFGAMQNRFEHTINNLNVAIENLSASESRIRDTDMAQEMMQFTRAQILSQAGTAMLAQANQAPQGVLQLLR